MSFRRWRRKMRCLFKHGPRGCPHIERHTRRSKNRPQPQPAPFRPEPLPQPQSADSPGRHAMH